MLRVARSIARPSAMTSVGPDQANARAVNNLDALRLLAALAVLIGHSFALTGRDGASPAVAGVSMEQFALFVFFSLSGYLIAQSWQRSPRASTFLVARSLRIFPALAAVVATSVFVIGPATTSLSAGEYFARHDTWTYLTNVALRVQYYLPGVWDDLPTRFVNGSIWTLPIEFACYLALPVILTLGRRAPVAALAATVVVTSSVAYAPHLGAVQVWKSYVGSFAQLWMFFAVGALCWLLEERRLLRFRARWAAPVLLAYAILLVAVPDHAFEYSGLFVPYIALTLGLASTSYLRRLGRFGDFSYGTYLWAWPVQQLVVDAGGPHDDTTNVVLVTGITLILAVVSWTLVERPALDLKARLRRRPGASPVGVTS